MNINRLYLLVLTHFRFNTRNRTAFFFTIIFPLIFIGVFGIAFQASDPTNTTIKIALINKDGGIPSNVVAQNSLGDDVVGLYYSEEFITLLGSITYADNSTNIFDIQEYEPNEEEKATEDVERRDKKGLLILNDDFSLGVLAAIRRLFELSDLEAANYPPDTFVTNVELRGDRSLLEFSIASSVLESVVTSYFAFGNPTNSGAIFEIVSDLTSEGFTIFDFIVPGLVVFAIINNMTTVALIAIRDVDTDLLGRLRLSKMKSWEYITALLISQMVMSFI
ncbi:MAG: ABC transporter permease [Candidatus Heimdallarchaeota archaeon]|nr:ABC transporter permease [Candidatus Heimdallarchaeota archaeon]